MSTDDNHTSWGALRAPNNNVDSPTPQDLFLGREDTSDYGCFRFGIRKSGVPHRDPNNGATR